MQDSGLLLLTYYSRKADKRGTPDHGHIVLRQSRRCIEPHRRQLCGITNQHKLAACAITHKADKVLQQIARTE